MTERPAPPAETHFRCLDGLRGIAVLLVVVKHTTTPPVSTSVVSQFFHNFIWYCGDEGVALFFALSGFLVSLPFWRLRTRQAVSFLPRDYAWRRFIKIYPPLALTLLVFYPIYVFFNPHGQYLGTVLAWLTGVAVFVPVNGEINPVLWTLVAEIQYYLVLPCAMLASARLPLRFSLWTVPGAFFLVGLVARRSFQAFGVSDSLWPQLYIPPLVHLDAFSVGALVAGLHATGKLGRASTVMGQCACVGSVGLILALSCPVLSAIYAAKGSWGQEACIFVRTVFFGSMLLILGDPKCFFARLLSRPLLCWFGLVSYEWYLIHYPVYLWIRDSVGATHGHALVHIAMQTSAVALGLVLAALTYYAFSAPLLRWGKRPAEFAPSQLGLSQPT